MNTNNVIGSIVSICMLLAACDEQTTGDTPQRADLSGVWMPYPDVGQELDPDLPLPPTPMEEALPTLKPEYLALWEAEQQAQADAAAAGKPKIQIDDACLPYGMPKMMRAPFPIEILQVEGMTMIIGEAYSEVRRIYMDEELPPGEELEPTWEGHSAGHWEGNTLVIETSGIKDYVRARDVPHSANMRITERLTFLSKDMLHNYVTVEDPEYLSEPWTFGWAYIRAPGYRMAEYVCEANREYSDPETGEMRLLFFDE